MKNLFRPNSFLSPSFIFWRPAEGPNTDESNSEKSEKGAEGLKVDEKAFTEENIQKLTNLYAKIGNLDAKKFPKDSIANRVDELTGAPGKTIADAEGFAKYVEGNKDGKVDAKEIGDLADKFDKDLTAWVDSAKVSFIPDQYTAVSESTYVASDFNYNETLDIDTNVLKEDILRLKEKQKLVDKENMKKQVTDLVVNKIVSLAIVGGEKTDFNQSFFGDVLPRLARGPQFLIPSAFELYKEDVFMNSGDGITLDLKSSNGLDFGLRDVTILTNAELAASGLKKSEILSILKKNQKEIKKRVGEKMMGIALDPENNPKPKKFNEMDETEKSSAFDRGINMMAQRLISLEKSGIKADMDEYLIHGDKDDFLDRTLSQGIKIDVKKTTDGVSEGDLFDSEDNIGSDQEILSQADLAMLGFSENEQFEDMFDADNGAGLDALYKAYKALKTSKSKPTLAASNGLEEPKEETVETSEESNGTIETVTETVKSIDGVDVTAEFTAEKITAVNDWMKTNASDLQALYTAKDKFNTSKLVSLGFAAGNVKTMQYMLGINTDGIVGRGTRRAIGKEFLEMTDTKLDDYEKVDASYMKSQKEQYALKYKSEVENSTGTSDEELSKNEVEENVNPIDMKVIKTINYEEIDYEEAKANKEKLKKNLMVLKGEKSTMESKYNKTLIAYGSEKAQKLFKKINESELKIEKLIKEGKSETSSEGVTLIQEKIALQQNKIKRLKSKESNGIKITKLFAMKDKLNGATNKIVAMNKKIAKPIVKPNTNTRVDLASVGGGKALDVKGNSGGIDWTGNHVSDFSNVIGG